MDRRTVLKLISVATALLPSVPLYSSTGKPVDRLALVIGVNKVRDSQLATLKGAASDARKVAEWLELQGFTVKLFVDQVLNSDGSPSDNYNDVTVRQIKDVVNPLLENEPIKELVVYFSGHGYNARGDNDFWLLSNAPRETDEAINFTSLNTAAKKFKINNITYIVDACRSTSKHLIVQDLIGSPVFFSPGKTASIPRSIDKLFAAIRGEQAYEISSAVEAHNEAVFTNTFLSAYSKPWVDMIKTVDSKQVVPSRKLTDFLRKEVPVRARKSDITLEQFPDIAINSEDDYFLGEYSGPEIMVSDVRAHFLSLCSPTVDIAIDKYGNCMPNLPGLGPLPEPEPSIANIDVSPTVKDIASVKFDSSLPHDATSTEYSEEQIDAASDELGVDELYELITKQLKDVASISPDEHSVLVVGDDIKDCLFVPSGSGEATKKGFSALTNGMGAVEGIPVHGSVILRFKSGAGTVVANIPEYVCAVLTDGKEVKSVTYRYPTVSADVLDRVAYLQAQVATISNIGSFRIDGVGQELNKNARRFGSILKTEKISDPTLAIYAAYAYLQADLYSDIKTIFTDHKLRYTFFDIAMLAENLNNQSYPHNGISPFCPMLTQGWGLLEVNEVDMPMFLYQAMRHLNDSLWTCFNEEGMEIIINHYS